MTSFDLIQNARILGSDSSQSLCHLSFSQGRIKDLIRKDPPLALGKVWDAQGHWLLPGFIDIQTNGCGGVLFNDAPTVESLKVMSLKHAQLGTTSFLPTLITDDLGKQRIALSAVQSALSEGVPGIVGIHFEGPCLNFQKKGIHPACYLQEAKELLAASWLEDPHLPPVLLTLAPEIFTEQELSFLKSKGFVLFAGHSNASYAQLTQAFRCGVSGVTHLFNACSSLQSREAGVVGAALLAPETYCSLIADGFHVCDEVLSLLAVCKSKEKWILVSDSMSPLGTSLSQFSLLGEEIFVQGGRYVNAQGTLAGAHISVHQAFQRIVRKGIASLSEAAAMSSLNAAVCMGLDSFKGLLEPGYDADMILVHKETLELLLVIQGGHLVFCASQW